MKILVGLLFAACGVGCVAQNRSLAVRQAGERRLMNLLGWKARVRVFRVFDVLYGLLLILAGVGLIVSGWKEFK
jgi:hypothetical protein